MVVVEPIVRIVLTLMRFVVFGLSLGLTLISFQAYTKKQTDRLQYAFIGFAFISMGVAVGALVAPATMALVTDIATPETRGAALGGFNVFGSLGFLAGFLLGGLATSTAGYLAAFLAVGLSEVAIAVVAGRAVWRISRRDAGGDDADPGVVRPAE